MSYDEKERDRIAYIKQNYPQLMKYEHRRTLNGKSDFVCYEPKCKLNGHNFATDAELYRHTHKFHMQSYNISD